MQEFRELEARGPGCRRQVRLQVAAELEHVVGVIDDQARMRIALEQQPVDDPARLFDCRGRTGWAGHRGPIVVLRSAKREIEARPRPGRDPVNLVLLVDDEEAVRVCPQRLGRPEHQQPVAVERVTEDGGHPLLLRGLQVDEEVAAGDQVEP